MPDPQSFDASMAAASGAGALANALANRSPDGWWRRAAEFGTGALVGIFVGPALADAVGCQNQHSVIAVAFGVGIAGNALLVMFMDAVKSQTFRDWLARLVEKRP